MEEKNPNFLDNSVMPESFKHIDKFRPLIWGANIIENHVGSS